MKKFIITILLTHSTILNAAQYSEAEIKAFMSKSESQLVTWLKKQGKAPAEITKYYLNAAEQAYMLHQSSVAKVLYKKALQRRDIENKIVAYFPIIEMELQSENIKEANKYYKEAELYLKANPSLRKKSIEESMTIFKLQISQKPAEVALTKNDRENVQLEHNNQMIYFHDLKHYLIGKNYDKAYQLMDGQDFTESDPNVKILADVVHTGAKKYRGSLYCQLSYDRSPELRDLSYSMKLCGILINIKSGVKNNEKEFVDLKNLLILRYPERLYLEQVARDLASRK